MKYGLTQNIEYIIMETKFLIVNIFKVKYLKAIIPYKETLKKEGPGLRKKNNNINKCKHSKNVTVSKVIFFKALFKSKV